MTNIDIDILHQVTGGNVLKAVGQVAGAGVLGGLTGIFVNKVQGGETCGWGIPKGTRAAHLFCSQPR